MLKKTVNDGWYIFKYKLPFSVIVNVSQVCVLYMCVVDKFGMDRYLYGGECVDVCPRANFHTALKACEPCPSHCKVCSSATHCITCEDSFYLHDGVCNALECGEGTASVIVKLIEMLLSINNESIIIHIIDSVCVYRGSRRSRI